MRLFLAIDLPFSVKKQLDTQLISIREYYPDFRWVSLENFHITLHFFGEKKDDQKIKEQLKKALFEQESFYLYSSSVNMFINYKKIIVYLSFQREKKLEMLVKKVKEELNQDLNTKFIPHLTLARYRLPSKQQYLLLKKKLRGLKINISFPVKKVVLFESLLEEGKPVVYKKREEIFLL